MLSEFAPAKINLTLRVTGRRADGYHLLDSLVVFAGAHDVLHATPAETLSLQITGPFGKSLAAEADNLVLRAAQRLADATRRQAGASLTLEKNLPIASGIGGGSADAAATLRLLARLWSVDIPAGLPLSLGADVPVCLGPHPRRMRSIGEALETPPALPPCGLVLVNPGVALSTQSVFRARSAAFGPADTYPTAWPNAAALAAWLAGSANDLEPAAVELCPAVADTLAALRATPDALLARMSGSGATCFALFPSVASAERAARAVARPGWWCWGGALWGGE